MFKEIMEVGGDYELKGGSMLHADLTHKTYIPNLKS
jgi:hypothetical protein